VRAIRVRPRGYGSDTFHWLLDEGRTYCGRDPAALDVAEQLELEKLPPVAACHACVRTADGWTLESPRVPADRVTAPPAAGRVRTTGPLNHGLRSRRQAARVIPDLVDRVAAARRSYLRVEHAAAAVDDDELTMRVDCARLALLDVVDRAAQLARETAELEAAE
jgi:hypothetical protein